MLKIKKKIITRNSVTLLKSSRTWNESSVAYIYQWFRMKYLVHNREPLQQRTFLGQVITGFNLGFTFTHSNNLRATE